MKKLLFGAYSLELGGIEKALVILLNELQKKGYDITLVLEKKQGIFLKELNPKIEIVEYTPSDSKNIIKRKFDNLCKRRKFEKEYKNKFDFSACFATYSLPASFVARTASQNCYLWGHADYLTLFQDDEKQMKDFFEQRKYEKFKKIVFVSNEGRDSFLKVFPEMKDRVIVCNNLIDANKILELSEEKIPEDEQEMLKENKEKILKEKSGNKFTQIVNKIVNITKGKKDVVTFINVGRHDERQKRLSRLIDAAFLLKRDNLNFRILFVGDGPQTEKYKKQVKEKGLEDNIIFLGRKENPYPYYKMSDCVVLTSDYEGYPVVFLESYILNKPIITTKVSDYKEIENRYGYVTGKTYQDIYEKMKLFINDGFKITEKFDSQAYNDKILKKVEELINAK